MDALRNRLAKIQKARDGSGSQEEQKVQEVNGSAEDTVVVKQDFIATGSRDKLIKVWNAERGESVMTLAGHDGWVNKVIFHHNGKYLLSGSDDKSVRIWDLANNGVCV